MYQISTQEIEDVFRDSYGNIYNRSVFKISKTGMAHLKQYLGHAMMLDCIKEFNSRLNQSLDFQKPFAYRTNSGYASGQEFFYNVGFGVINIQLYNTSYKSNQFYIHAFPFYVSSRRCGKLLYSPNQPLSPSLESDILDMLEKQVHFINRAQQVADSSLHAFIHRAP